MADGMLSEKPAESIACVTPGHDHEEVGDFADGSTLYRCHSCRRVWTEDE